MIGETNSAWIPRRPLTSKSHGSACAAWNASMPVLSCTFAPLGTSVSRALSSEMRAMPPTSCSTAYDRTYRSSRCPDRSPSVRPCASVTAPVANVDERHRIDVVAQDIPVLAHSRSWNGILGASSSVRGAATIPKERSSRETRQHPRRHRRPRRHDGRHRRRLRAGARTHAGRLALPPVDRAFIARTVGRGSTHLLTQTLAHVGGAPELLAPAWTHYQRHYAAVNGATPTSIPACARASRPCARAAGRSRA